MLQSLKFANFKSWAKADMQCAPITGIFGANSSGKTSLIQFLLLMKQTKDATDRAISLELNGDLVELGTVEDVIHRHDKDRVIEFDMGFRLADELRLIDTARRPQSAVARGDELGISAAIGICKGAPVSRCLAYTLGDMKFELAQKNGERSGFQLSAKSIGEHKNGFNFTRTQGRAWQLPGPIKSYGFPDQAKTYYQNAGFLADLQAAYEKALNSIYYLGPLRDFPKRDYLWSGSRPTDVGQHGENVIPAILAATAAGDEMNVGKNKRYLPFQKMVAHWLREMGLIDAFTVEEIGSGSNRWQARVQAQAGADEVFLTDVGFGVSQVLPVVTLLQYAPEGSTVILEQPEIHLHPLAQAKLADAIIQAATHRKVQVILESHSEHLLLRLQRRVAEEKISSEDVKLYFCDAPQGVSTLTPLQLDIFGNILNWPDKFMGDAFTETAKAEEARLQRRQAGE